MGAHDVAGRVTGQHIPTGINKFWVHGLLFFVLLFFTPRPVVVGTCKKKNDGKIRGVKKKEKKRKSPLSLLRRLFTFNFFRLRIQTFGFLHFYDVQKVKEGEVSIDCLLSHPCGRRYLQYFLFV